MAAPLVPLSFVESGLQRGERAVATTRHFDARAGTTLNEFPRVTLEIHCRRTLTRGAGTGGAIVLPLQCDAVALLFVSSDGSIGFGLGERCCVGD